MNHKSSLSIFPFRKSFSFLILIFLTQLSFNCAIFQKKNLLLVNAVEENLIPEDKNKKILTLPLIVPVGMIAGLLDVFIVHPISVLPRVSRETISSLWTSREKLGYVTRMGTIPFSTIASPPVFSFFWLHYWLFDGRDNNSINPPAVLSDEEWIASLEVNYKEKEWQKLEKGIQECRGTNQLSQLLPVLFLSYQQFLLMERKNSLFDILGCLGSIETYNLELENFYIDILSKDHSKDAVFAYKNNIANYFVNHTSKKGSQAMINMLSNPKLEPKWIPFIVDQIFLIGIESHKTEIIEKLQQTRL